MILIGTGDHHVDSQVCNIFSIIDTPFMFFLCYYFQIEFLYHPCCTMCTFVNQKYLHILTSELLLNQILMKRVLTIANLQ